MLTKVFIEKFKDFPMLSIYEVDTFDKKRWDKPLFSLGRKKIMLVIKHIKELKEFVEM